MLCTAGSQYAPDFSALARSDDGAASFQSVLSYAETVGRVDCPLGTPVGDECPGYWHMYGDQLGVSFSDGGVDAGVVVDGGGPPPPDEPGASSQGPGWGHEGRGCSSPQPGRPSGCDAAGPGAHHGSPFRLKSC